jgi:hypothetical protein
MSRIVFAVVPSDCDEPWWNSDVSTLDSMACQTLMIIRLEGVPSGN